MWSASLIISEKFRKIFFTATVGIDIMVSDLHNISRKAATLLNKKIITFLFLFAFLSCLFSVTAFAAPYHPGWQDYPFPSSLDGRLPFYPAEQEEPLSDASPEAEFQTVDVPSDDFYSEDVSYELASDDMNPENEENPVLPEETPESIEAAKAVANQIQPDGPVVIAVAEEEPASDAESHIVSVANDETCYSEEGVTVFNNGGTVYANFSVVYNNGGTVYANDGIVYNNAGTVYANGGTVYNNAGIVYSNAAIVFGFDDSGVTESMLQSAVFLEGASPAEESPAPDDMIGWEEIPAIYPDTEEADDMPVPEYSDNMNPTETPDDMNSTEVPDDMNSMETPADMIDPENADDMWRSPDNTPFFEDPMTDSDMASDSPVGSPEAEYMNPESPVYDFSPRYEDLYAPVLRTYLSFLNGEEPTGLASTEAGDEYLVLGETGVSSLSYSANILGYCLLDIDANGIPELLIGSYGSEYYDTDIYDMFTLKDGVPFRVLASNGQSSYQLTEDDLILLESVSGSPYDYASLYQLNGSDLELLTGVVLIQEDAVLNDHCYQFFGDAVADYRDDGQQEIEITREEYHVIVDILEDSVVPFELNAF